ncbi:MAG: hypothetical protein QNJ91_16435 [Gammaproteobacteria bacterium]|nr:hypothetical protein [Gammaproteobacteria bacterium]
MQARSLPAVAVAALVVALLAACGPAATPEQQIRQLVADMEAAVEDGSVTAAGELLHTEYADEWHPNRRAAVRSLFGYLRRHKDIHLFTVVRSVDVAADGRSADAVVYVAMTGVPVQSVETLLSVNADLFRFDIVLAQSDDAWRARRARWQRVGADAFR